MRWWRGIWRWWRGICKWHVAETCGKRDGALEEYLPYEWLALRKSGHHSARGHYSSILVFRSLVDIFIPPVMPVISFCRPVMYSGALSRPIMHSGVPSQPVMVILEFLPTRYATKGINWPIISETSGVFPRYFIASTLAESCQQQPATDRIFHKYLRS